MSKHTPGPFYVVEGNSTTLYIDDRWGLEGERDYYLGEVRHGDPQELIANANLFAAAPTLLAELRKARRLLDSVAFVAKEGDTTKLLASIDAAIVRATDTAPATLV
jgi:hypothetical protein